MKRNFVYACTAVFACLASAAHAQSSKPAAGLGDYPNRVIRVTVASAPGGGIDTFSRIVTKKMTEIWGRPIVVENRPDGSGALAIETLAKSPPDGYLFHVGGGDLSLAGPLKKVSFDTRTAYTPVVQLASSPYFLVVAPTLPVSSVKELIAYAKSKPGVLNYGSSGIGSPIHLGFEVISQRTGIQMVHVPYKGNTTAFTDLMKGQIHVMFTNPTSSVPLAKAGKLKLIATAGANRAKAFPDLPTIAETIPGYEHGNTSGLYGPAGLPPAITTAVNQMASRAVNSPEIKARIEADGSEVAAPHTPAEFRDRFLKRIAEWEEVIKKSGLKVEDLRE